MKITLQIAALIAKILPARVKSLFYRSPKLAGKIRNTLNAASPVGLTDTRVAGGFLQGFYLNLDMQTEKDYWLGTYEINLQAAIKKFCHPGMVIYDIGANIGYISLIFAKQVGKDGSVLSFEPLPDNCQRLSKNIALNKLDERISVYQAAVVDKPGTALFLVHKSGAMGKAYGSLGRDEHYLTEIEVQAITLDDFIFSQSHPYPDLIKMDIEGGEVLAIKGMHRTLAEIKPVLLVEIHSHLALDCLWAEFQSVDYQMVKMERGYPLINDPSALGEKTYVIAVPNKKAG
jgi:FkbM family methyltransferase